MTHRANLEQSNHLQQALRNKSLRLLKHSVIRSEQKIKTAETPTEKPKPSGISEDRLVTIIKQVLQHEREQNQSNLERQINETIGEGINRLVESVKGKLHTISSDQHEDIVIDEKQLAELQQKSIEQIKIESGGSSHAKKVVVKNTNLRDIANEL